MYRSFNLSIEWENEEYYNKGIKGYNSDKLYVSKELSKFISKDGSLDGSKMRDDWFPQVTADIFISHSHKDLKKAVCLSGFLSEAFGLEVFIDSCIWGNSAELLKIIDDRYCLEGEYYDYQSRNHSTSHVHMMLSTALNMMIDKSECLFFLNTPNSIKPSEVVESRTKSPWIYSEISISKLLVGKKGLSDYRPERQKAFSGTGGLTESVEIDYEISLDHMTEIDINSLNKWIREWEKVNLHQKFPLDILYKLNK